MIIYVLITTVTISTFSFSLTFRVEDVGQRCQKCGMNRSEPRVWTNTRRTRSLLGTRWPGPACREVQRFSALGQAFTLRHGFQRKCCVRERCKASPRRPGPWGLGREQVAWWNEEHNVGNKVQRGWGPWFSKTSAWIWEHPTDTSFIQTQVAGGLGQCLKGSRLDHGGGQGRFWHIPVFEMLTVWFFTDGQNHSWL